LIHGAAKRSVQLLGFGSDAALATIRRNRKAFYSFAYIAR
jgi:hypothetical protein